MHYIKYFVDSDFIHPYYFTTDRKIKKRVQPYKVMLISSIWSLQLH